MQPAMFGDAAPEVPENGLRGLMSMDLQKNQLTRRKNFRPNVQYLGVRRRL
nr:hypothetical protein OG781_09175 [Streptomyces sp. NBC_00830]